MARKAEIDWNSLNEDQKLKMFDYFMYLDDLGTEGLRQYYCPDEDWDCNTCKVVFYNVNVDLHPCPFEVDFHYCMETLERALRKDGWIGKRV